MRKTVFPQFGSLNACVLGLVTSSVVACSGSSELQGDFESGGGQQIESELDGYDDVLIALDDQDMDDMSLVRGAIKDYLLRTSGDANCWVGGNRDFSLPASGVLKVYRSASNCKLEIRGFTISTTSSSNPVEVILLNPVNASSSQSSSEFSNAGMRGQLSVASAISANAGGTLRLNLIFADLDPSEIAFSYRGCDGGKTHGAIETRTRFENSTAMSPSVCRSESQTRTCHEGIWSTWTGTYSHESCVAIAPTPTPTPVQVNGSGATVCGQPLAFFNERGFQTGGTARLVSSNTIVFNLVSDVSRVNNVRVNVSSDCKISVSLEPGMQPNMCYRHNDSTCSVGGYVSGQWRANCESPVIWKYQNSQGQIGSKACSSGRCEIRTQAGTLLWSGDTDIHGCHITCHNTNVLDIQGRPLVSTSPNRTCMWNGGSVR